MFDIAFSELMIIGLVALIIIGPERLPKVARTVGTWLGRLNRYVSQVKQDIDRDMQLEELRKLQQQMKDSVQKYEILAQEAKQGVEQEVGQMDKLMKAMAATDGGLSMQEYEKIQSEKAATDTELAETGDTEPKADPDDKAVTAASESVATASSPPPAEPESFTSALDDELVVDDMNPSRDDDLGHKLENKTEGKA